MAEENQERPQKERKIMKPLPAPKIPGNTEAERFDNAVRKTFTVSKEEMQRREAEWQRVNAESKGAKKS